MSISKVTLNNESILDLTNDTVISNTLHDDIVALKADGTSIQGNVPYPSLENELIEKTITGTYIDSNITAIAAYAFDGCASLTGAIFPNVISLGTYAFYGCTSLTNVNCNKITATGQYAFCNCTSLTDISCPFVTIIGAATFQGCSNLININFPQVTTVGSGSFSKCYKLQLIYLPECTTWNGTGQFGSATYMTTLILPKLITTGTDAFRESCIYFADMGPGYTIIKTRTFYNYHILKNLILRSSTLVTLQDGSSISNFRPGGELESIWIPKSLYDHLGDGTEYDYLSAANWSAKTWCIAENFHPIEGSQYEHYYADGTPIPQQEEQS